MVKRTALCLLTAWVPALWAASATVDKNPVLLGEAITLTVSSESSHAQPDFSILEKDFQILQQGRSTQLSVVNGQTRRTQSWTLSLLPKAAGSLQIPALPIGGELTRPITVTVQRPDPGAGRMPVAFIEMELDQDEVWVRQQVIATVRLFVAGELASGNLSDPEIPGAVIDRLDETSDTMALRGNTRYRVIERRYAIFPEQAGSLELSAPVFSGELLQGRQPRSMFDFGARTRAIHASGKPRRIVARAPPADFGAPWLPASSVELRDELVPGEGPYKVGEALTRVVRLQVDGQLHTQVNLPEADYPLDLQVYPETPEQETVSRNGLLSASLVRRTAIIPAAAGEFVLPALRLKWWDVRANKAREATLPARRITVAAAAAQRPAQPPAGPAAGTAQGVDAPPPASGVADGRWRTLALAALAGWVTTLALWLALALRGRRRKRAAAPAPDSGADLRAVGLALARRDAAAARQALLQWARVRFPEHPIDGLKSLGRAAGSADFAAALQQLDRHLYGDGGDWDAQALRTALDAVAAVPPARRKTPALPARYPEPTAQRANS